MRLSRIVRRAIVVSLAVAALPVASAQADWIRVSASVQGAGQITNDGGGVTFNCTNWNTATSTVENCSFFKVYGCDWCNPGIYLQAWDAPGWKFVRWEPAAPGLLGCMPGNAPAGDRTCNIQRRFGIYFYPRAVFAKF